MRHRPTPLLALLLVPAAIAACSSPTVQESGATTAAGGSQGGTGGSAGTGGDAGTMPVACAWTPQTSNATCPAGPCPIGLDEVLTCQDTEFAAPGLRVAPAPDATWLATSSTNDREVYRLTASGEERQDGVPAAYLRTTIALALAPDGTVHLGADTTLPVNTPQGLTYVGGVVHATRTAAGVWSSSEVYGNSDKYAPLVDLEVSAAGAPGLWIVTDAPDAYSLATPSAQGDAWTLTSAPVPEAGAWNRFTRSAADGSTVSLAIEAPPSGYQLHALVGGADRDVGSPFSGPGLWLMAVTPAEAPTSSSGPLFAVALEAEDGIHVVGEPGSGPEVESLVPGTLPLAGSCVAPGDLTACTGSCHSTGTGLEDGAYALARTDDGNVWLAYVVTALDQTIDWSVQGDPGAGFCAGDVGKDSSQGTLHLVRVPADGSAPAEVLAMPIDRPGGQDAFSDLNQSVRFVDARGFGTDLAVGVRTGWVGGPFAVRVLRLDTTRL